MAQMKYQKVTLAQMIKGICEFLERQANRLIGCFADGVVVYPKCLISLNYTDEYVVQTTRDALQLRFGDLIGLDEFEKRFVDIENKMDAAVIYTFRFFLNVESVYYRNAISFVRQAIISLATHKMMKTNTNFATIHFERAPGSTSYDFSSLFECAGQKGLRVSLFPDCIYVERPIGN